jgi:hypothetical protein
MSFRGLFLWRATLGVELREAVAYLLATMCARRPGSLMLGPSPPATLPRHQPVRNKHAGAYMMRATCGRGRAAVRTSECNLKPTPSHDYRDLDLDQSREAPRREASSRRLRRSSGGYPPNPQARKMLHGGALLARQRSGSCMTKSLQRGGGTSSCKTTPSRCSGSMHTLSRDREAGTRGEDSRQRIERSGHESRKGELQFVPTPIL